MSDAEKADFVTPGYRAGTTRAPRAMDDGLCAFCGQETSAAELMDEIHLLLELLASLAPGEDGFNETLDEVRSRFSA